jgi:hypothetical protein
MPRSPRPEHSADEQVPLFGTWRAAYLAVVACALLIMLALRLFQGWPF